MSAFDQLPSGLTIGHAGLGQRGANIEPPSTALHDGDTAAVRAIGNLSVRLLNMDTAEVSFGFPPEGKRFVPLSDPAWKDFLTDPYAEKFGPLHLDAELKVHLRNRLGPDTASNHAKYAELGRTAFINEVNADITALGKTNDSFKFFLAFAHEALDRYGRLLAFINREDPSPSRPPDYNVRQLENGVACPYFIWPNVGKYSGKTLLDLVLKPNKAREWAAEDKYLKQVRSAAASARQKNLGIFDKHDPLKLAPFELRYLAQRRAPERWVIDLSKSDDVLVTPQRYYHIPHMEDRLFVPAEYVPLFVNKGWRTQAATAAVA
ncbi:MAG TPA: hypothetical protein VFA68_21720 [Terriglobales bacterium]|nr:hypothetical protein [Terriglobales bacterium]